MAVHIFRAFTLLTAISLGMMFCIILWQHLASSSFCCKDYWHRSSGGGRWLRTGFTWWKKNETLKQPLVGFTTLTQTNPKTPIPVIEEKSFSQLPVWDFDDVYVQDAPPRQKICAKSLRESKDKSFKELFLPNIRLFLHKDNLNVSEWNRLSHFNSPFGFLGLQYDDLMATVKLIPKPTEPLIPQKQDGDGCVRCAVVGNGGILLGSKLGAEIDAHDHVFRVNGAVINNFEEDVGSRTSVYVHSAHAITKALRYYKSCGYKSAPHDEGIKYVLMPEMRKDYQWLESLIKGERVSAGPYRKRKAREYYSGQYNETRFYVLHQDFLRYVRNRFLKTEKLKTKRWASIRPTNGAFTVFLAIHTCDIVNIYGFMTEDFRKYAKYYCQEDAKGSFSFHSHHDFYNERDAWIKLHQSGIIKLYQR